MVLVEARPTFGEYEAVLLVAGDLVVEAIFFTIEVHLLARGDEAAIDASVTLLLPANGSVFCLQLPIVTIEIAVVGVDAVVDVVVAVQHFGAAWVALSERPGEAGHI